MCPHDDKSDSEVQWDMYLAINGLHCDCLATGNGSRKLKPDAILAQSLVARQQTRTHQQHLQLPLPRFGHKNSISNASSLKCCFAGLGTES